VDSKTGLEANPSFFLIQVTKATKKEAWASDQPNTGNQVSSPFELLPALGCLTCQCLLLWVVGELTVPFFSITTHLIFILPAP
jgi:hypothetical protein